MKRRDVVKALGSAPFVLTSLTGGRSAWADDYPSRPITLIVPQAPGGGNDTIARIIAQKMTQSLDQQVIVENRPGGGGTLGEIQLGTSKDESLVRDIVGSR